MEQTDESIIARVLEGDRNAFAGLVERYKDRVFSLAMGIIRNKERAEELAQDAFLKAFRSLGSFRGDSSFSSWLYRITYNTAISESRKGKTRILTFDEQIHKADRFEAVEPPEDDLKEQQQRFLHRALDSMDPEDKLILMLYYFEEKSVEEISITTGLSRSNTKVKLFRLRGKLRTILEQSGRATLAMMY